MRRFIIFRSSTTLLLFFGVAVLLVGVGLSVVLLLGFLAFCCIRVWHKIKQLTINSKLSNLILFRYTFFFGAAVVLLFAGVAVLLVGVGSVVLSLTGFGETGSASSFFVVGATCSSAFPFVAGFLASSLLGGTTCCVWVWHKIKQLTINSKLSNLILFRYTFFFGAAVVLLFAGVAVLLVGGFSIWDGVGGW